MRQLRQTFRFSNVAKLVVVLAGSDNKFNNMQRFIYNSTEKKPFRGTQDSQCVCAFVGF